MICFDWIKEGALVTCPFALCAGLNHAPWADCVLLDKIVHAGDNCHDDAKRLLALAEQVGTGTLTWVKDQAILEPPNGKTGIFAWVTEGLIRLLAEDTLTAGMALDVATQLIKLAAKAKEAEHE